MSTCNGQRHYFTSLLRYVHKKLVSLVTDSPYCNNTVSIHVQADFFPKYFASKNLVMDDLLIRI